MVEVIGDVVHEVAALGEHLTVPVEALSAAEHPRR